MPIFHQTSSLNVSWRMEGTCSEVKRQYAAKEAMGFNSSKQATTKLR